MLHIADLGVQLILTTAQPTPAEDLSISSKGISSQAVKQHL